jgi:hypothetical protein
MAELILRPNGTHSSGASVYPSGTPYEAVDEVSSDGDTTYVYSSGGGVACQLDFPNHTTESGDINSVTIYAIARETEADGTINLGFHIPDSYTSNIALTTSYATKSWTSATNPATAVDWTWDDIDALVCHLGIGGTKPRITMVWVVVDYTPDIVAPTVTTQSCTNLDHTTLTGNGNITNTGGENCTRRGFCYKSGTSGDPTTADSTVYDDGDFGTGAYTKGLTGLTQGTSYRVRAYTVNSAGTAYGDTVQTQTVGLKELGETLGVVDTKLTDSTLAKGEAFNVTDSKVTSISIAKGESFSIADTFNVLIRFGESLAIADTLMKSGALAQSEPFETVDSIEMTAEIALAIALNILDSLTNSASLAKGEALSITDTKATSVLMALAETLSLTDTITNAASLLPDELLTIIDTIWYNNPWEKESKGTNVWTKETKGTNTWTKESKTTITWIKENKKG